MRIWRDLRLLARVTHPQRIARRYFVTNGFDGALASLGLVMGFYVGEGAPIRTVLTACLGMAVALMVSGVSSAYVSEAAERRRELEELRAAMLSEIQLSAHARAASLIPWLIAAVNGLAPLLMALLISAPLWLYLQGVPLPLPPLESAIAMAFLLIFLLGVFLSRVSGSFWLWSALRTLLIAALTAGLILLFDP